MKIDVLNINWSFEKAKISNSFATEIAVCLLDLYGNRFPGIVRGGLPHQGVVLVNAKDFWYYVHLVSIKSGLQRVCTKLLCLYDVAVTQFNQMTELWIFVSCPNRVEPPKPASYLKSCIISRCFLFYNNNKMSQ